MSSLTTTDIFEEMAFLDDWESRYQYIIDLGRDLPKMDEALRTPDRLVKGCQSNVWMHIHCKGEKLQFIVDSNAHIVRGLLVLVLAAYNNKSALEISNFDIDNYFKALDLQSHLSLIRGNGLRSIVAKIRTVAAAVLADNYLTQ